MVDMDQHWRSLSFVSIDLEGTGGQDKEKEEILEIGVVKVNGGKADRQDHFHRLVRPFRPVPRRPWLSLTNDDVKDALTFDEIKIPLLYFLGQAIMVAHNARVDWKLLRRKCATYRPPLVLDTLRLARYAYPGQKSYRLSDLVHQFRLDQHVRKTPAFKPHRALYDAYMTAQLFVFIVESSFPHMTIGEFMRICGVDIDHGEQGTLF